MCRISGIFDYNMGHPPRREELEAMCLSLTHRGPDGQRVFCDPPIGFGHTRLSIIDLKTGDQPMSNEDGNI